MAVLPLVITLKGLFSEIDLAKSGINQNVAPKGKVDFQLILTPPLM